MAGHVHAWVRARALGSVLLKCAERLLSCCRGSATGCNPCQCLLTRRAARSRVAMRFFSTRGAARAYTFEEALLAGYAEDGGMLMPAEVPRVLPAELGRWAGLSYKVCWLWGCADGYAACC